MLERMQLVCFLIVDLPTARLVPTTVRIALLSGYLRRIKKIICIVVIRIWGIIKNKRDCSRIMIHFVIKIILLFTFWNDVWNVCVSMSLEFGWAMQNAIIAIKVRPAKYFNVEYIFFYCLARALKMFFFFFSV